LDAADATRAFGAGNRNPIVSEFDFEAVKDLIRCPETRAELVYHNGMLVSTDPDSRLRYTVKDGIPNLLVDDAEPLPQGQWEDAMRANGRDPRTGAAAC
jgi:uncharacterized protein YbaR (Trm112 family)